MPDSGLTGDECLFINDGPPDAWWLSPDIVVNGFDGVPVPIGAQTVTVTTRCNSGSKCSGTANQAMRVELWVAVPAPVMDKTNSASALRIGLLPETAPAAGGSKPVPFTWNIPNVATGPNSPGHKCLIGIVYPSGLSPDARNFYPPDDAHYAQKNLCIVTCSSPCGADMQTANPSRNEPENVILQAIADPRPSAAVQKAILPALKKFGKFRGFAKGLPPPFGFTFKSMKEVKVTSYLEPGSRTERFGKLSVPNVQARFALKPKQLARFRLSTDLKGVTPGEAFVIHVTHSVGQKIKGGVTVVFVKV